MKVFVLTSCNEYGSSKPEVFTEYSKAESALVQRYEDACEQYDCEDQELRLTEGYAYVVEDGHSVSFKIYECEVD